MAQTTPVTHNGKSRPSRDKPRITARRQLLIFCVVAVATLVLLSVGAVFACRSVARGQAFADAERMTSRLADYVVGPMLSAALKPGSAQRSELDRTMQDRIRDGYLSEVMVWNAAGRVVWASDPQNIGRVVQVPPAATAAITHRVITSDFDTHPEVTHPGQVLPVDGFVEVYVPFPHNAQPALAFEAYYDYARVNETANLLTRQMLPLALAPIVLLQLIQVPIAISLTRRVRRQDAERSVLLERNLTVSDRERVRIAADLHDGPIQDFAGIGYALAAIAPAVPEQHHQLMATVQETVRRSVMSLRRMMVDLYPPDLEAAQLPSTIAALAVPLRERGIAVEVDVESVLDLNSDTVTALYQIAREALVNIVKHAHATKVQIVLKMNYDNHHHPSTVELKVSDNGIGLDLRRLDRRADGHLGLRLLMDRVKDLGGNLDIISGHSGGTDLLANLPVAGKN